MLIQPNIISKRVDGASADLSGAVVGAFISTHQPRWQWSTLTRDGTTFTAYGTLGTKPTTNVLYESLLDCPSILRLMPFTDTSANTTGSIRVVGWSMYLDNGTQDWIPTVLADVALTRTSGTSPKNPIITTPPSTTTDYFPFASATATAGTPAPSLYSLNASGAPVMIAVDTLGSQLIQITCIGAAGTMGVLWNTL